MKISGSYCNGQGFAFKSIRMQMPFFHQLPGSKELYPGTINIKPNCSYKILSFDFAIENIQWYPGITETFGFMMVKSLFIAGQRRKLPAYLYFASGSKTLHNLGQLEIISVKQDMRAINYDSEIQIEINEGHMIKVG